MNIQEEINKLGGKPGAVILDGGDYQIDKPITMNSASQSLICFSRAIIKVSSDIEAIIISNSVEISNISCRNTNQSTKAGVKLIDGAKMCKLNDIRSSGFYYGLEMYSSVTPGGIAYNQVRGGFFRGLNRGIYGHVSGDGWCNENLFFGSRVGMPSDGSHIEFGGNNNKFYGLCCEGGTEGKYAILENGVNYWDGLRLETNCSGFNVNNPLKKSIRVSRISNIYWDCKMPHVTVSNGFVYVDHVEEDGFYGIMTKGQKYGAYHI